MATIGQIVYNIRDYNSDGNRWSSRDRNPSSLVNSKDANYDTLKVNIFQNIIGTQVSIDQFKKIGIQAPPGTRFLVNRTAGSTEEAHEKSFRMGRTGIFELDNDQIPITTLYFVKPTAFKLDQEATDEALKQGKLAMETAETNRSKALADIEVIRTNAIANLNDQFPPPRTEEEQQAYDVGLKQIDSDYWTSYVQIQQDFQTEYNEALRLYSQGINGVFIDAGFADLNDIIIDYTY